MDRLITSLIAWLVVIPSLLFGALMLARIAYQAKLTRQKQIDHDAAVKRVENQTETTRTQLNLPENETR